MTVEEIGKNKNTVTIAVFVIVCFALNLESFASLFHFKIPEWIRNYVVFFPLFFAVVIFTQKKTYATEINNEVLWETKRRSSLFVNKKRMILRYSIITIVAAFFLFSNIYESRSGLSSQNGLILIYLLIGIAITFIYGYLKKGFQIGFCDKGILYGYNSKLMLIKWEDMTDFEIYEENFTITTYCKKKFILNKVVLKNTNHFPTLKTLVSDKLTYKNITKLLTDD